MLQTFWLKLQSDERGATAVEYGLLVSLIAVVIAATVLVLGTQLKTAFESVVNAL
ncbi:MAG: Flp family type IVb pilin [Actinobacteria bacterium]|nr:Flp family type IVb pilin [Actinomycetota bacterium]